jgi:glutathione S-transferase
MRMPTLKDGDYVLWESNAIAQYLASKRPESGLLPKDERARLDVTRWQFWELAHWHPACAIFAFENVVKPLLGLGEPDKAELAKGTEAFKRAATVLEGQLKDRKFVTGDTLTLADFSIGAAMNLAEMAHFPAARAARLAENVGTDRDADRDSGLTSRVRTDGRQGEPVRVPLAWPAEPFSGGLLGDVAWWTTQFRGATRQAR